MATIVNDRDVLLQAASPRNNAPALGKAFVLSSDTQVFHVTTGGTGSPTLANLTTQRINIASTVTWGVTGATGVTVAGDTFSATLAFSAMTASTATVTAQTVYLGVTYTQTQIINKVVDGAAGSPGSNGSNGANGSRGTVTLVGNGYSAWSDSDANNVISANGSGIPINGDIVTLTNGSSFTQTKFYSFGTWYVLTAYIDGNLLVTGTLSASKINGGTFTGAAIDIGSGQFTVTTGGLTNAYNFFGYNSAFGNLANPSIPALAAANVFLATAPPIRSTSNASSVAAIEAIGTIALNCSGTTLSQIVQPSTDNSYTCGASGARWSVVWAATATISTSDGRTKTDVQDTDLGLSYINALRPKSCLMVVGHNDVVDAPELEVGPWTEGAFGPWLPDTRMPTKVVPRAGRRRHEVFIAQEVKAELDARGRDSSMHVLADAEDPNSLQGLRYEGFIPPIVKAVQEVDGKVDALYAIIAELKAEIADLKARP